MFENLKLAVIYGGVSSEHDASLKGFDFIYDSIKEGTRLKEDFTDVFYIYRDGRVKHSSVDYSRDSTEYASVNKFNTTIIEAFSYIKQNDLFVLPLLMHGQNGEDGNIQGLATFLDLKGCYGNSFASSITMDKYHLNRYLENQDKNIFIPKTKRISSIEQLENIFKEFENQDIIVKPNSLGASLHTEKYSCLEKNKKDITKLCSTILEFDHYVLVQEFIEGAEYSCGCLQKEGKVEILPLIKVDFETEFFNHEAKHKSGKCAVNVLTLDTIDEVEQIICNHSKEIFEELNLQYLARIDYIRKGDKIYFLEVNTLPGFKQGSFYPVMLETIGMDIEDLLYTMINESLQVEKKNTTIHYTIG